MAVAIHIAELKFAYQGDSLFIAKNLHLKEGEKAVLIGENGSGKTTFLKLIAGINGNPAGVKIFGKELVYYSKSEKARLLAYVATDRPLTSLIKTKEFIAYGRYPYLSWLTQLRQEDKQLIEQLMLQCNLEELAEQFISELSDGEIQRLKIAQGLSQQTNILLLDEPTAHLDNKSANSILRLIDELTTKTVLFSTHQWKKALKIVDQVWVIDQAQLKAYSVAEFKADRELHLRVFGEYEI